MKETLGETLGGSSSTATSYDGLVLIDVRNHFESEIGHFDGATRCSTRRFDEFPAWADALIAERGLVAGGVSGERSSSNGRNSEPSKPPPKVLMYCTGGIRCERASAYLRSKGVTECFQLRGGIHTYCEAMAKESVEARLEAERLERRTLRGMGRRAEAAIDKQLERVAKLDSLVR